MIAETLTELGLDELRAMRGSALAALQRLIEGENIVTVTGIGGRTTTYQPANADRLRGWVAELSAAIRQLETGQLAAGPILPEW